MALPSQDIQALANAAEERKRREQEDSIAEEAVMTAGAGSLALFKAQQAKANLANEAAERIAKPLTHNQGGNLNARGTIGSNMPTNPASPATGPSGGTSLPSQPTAAETRAAATRSAYSANSSTTGGFNTPSGTASTGTSGTTGTSTARNILNTSKDTFNAGKNKLVKGLSVLSKMPSGVQNLEAMGYGAMDRFDDIQRLTNTGRYSDEAIAAANQRYVDQREMIENNRITDISDFFVDVKETPEQANARILGERREQLNEIERRTERMLPSGLNSFAQPNEQASKLTDTIDQYLGNLMRRENFFTPEPNEKSASDLLVEQMSKLEAARDSFSKGEARVAEGLPFDEPKPISEKKILPFQSAENPNGGSSGKVPTSETEAEPLTGLDLYNDMYGKLMEKQGGKISDEQIKFARQRASEEGFGLDPEKGFFKQDFEGQDFEGQSIGEYLNVEFKAPKGAEIVGTEGMPVNFKPSSDSEMVKTLDPNTGEMMMADRETANAIADFYGRQRRGEALTRQEALASPEMREFSNRQLRNVIDSEYSRESEAREDRIANRPDFNEPFRSGADSGPKTYGGYTTSELRGMVGGGKDLRRAQILAENGKDPLTGKDVESNEMSEYQRGVLELENKKFEQSQIDSAKPETMTPYQTEMVNLAKDKYEDVKSAAAAAAEVAAAEGATQADKDALDIAQKRVNLSQSYLDLVQDSEEVPEDVDLGFEKFESKLDALEDTLDIKFDDRTKTFYKGKKRNTILPNSQEGRIMAADPFFKLVFDQYPVKK